MKFKKKEPIQTDGFYYDLFAGYIIPERILKKKHKAKELNKAINLIEQFRQELYDNNLIEDV